MMARFGVRVERNGWRSFTLPAGGRYVSPGDRVRRRRCVVGVVFSGRGAIGGGPVRVEGVGATACRATCVSPRRSGRMGARVEMGRQLDRSTRPGEQAKLKAFDLDLQPHSRCRDDAGRGGAVRRRHDHVAQHRQLARERDRPHRGDGDRVAQGRRDGGGGRGLQRIPATRLSPSAVRSHRHLRRSPHGDVLLAGRARRCGGAHQRSEVRGQDFPRVFRRALPK